MSGSGNCRPIGVFDSGAGGISVLRELRRLMPGERFVYFGDSAHTPYGSRPVEWIRERSARISGFLVDRMGAKAVVIACNTATAAAADHIRQAMPDVPVFGIEPALKPAATENPGGTILVMATEATLRLDRFRLLVDRWGTGSAVVSVPCPGLADAIEDGMAGTPELRRMVEGFVGEWRGHADAVVLGCTHYPFVVGAICDALGDGVRVYDGAEGTARNVRSTLGRMGLLAGMTGDSEARPDLTDGLFDAGGHDGLGLGAWSMPDEATLLMTSGTPEHIARFESLGRLGQGEHAGQDGAYAGGMYAWGDATGISVSA